MPALRLHLFKSVESKFYRFTNPAQHALYKEVLTFNGAQDELYGIARKLRKEVFEYASRKIDKGEMLFC